MMKIYEVVAPGDSHIFHRLLEIAIEHCDTFTLTVGHSKHATAILNGNLVIALEPYLVCQRETDRWPGTVNGVATLLKFRLTQGSIGVLKERVQHPLDLLSPNLPEDLSLLRPDGRPWFVSIAHEHCAYFELENDAEYQFIVEHLGNSSIEYLMDSTGPDSFF